MAEITRVTPSLASILPPATHQHSNLKAGEALANGDFVYIKSDGKLWKATGAAANAAALSIGITFDATPVGESASVYHGITVRYAAGMTPGVRLFLSAATAGGLADVATTGGTVPVAVVVDATRIYVLEPNR